MKMPMDGDGITERLRADESEPISLFVNTPRGSTVAQLLTGPGCRILGVKTQLAGIDGTPVDNQTLLLGGRVLSDTATVASSGIVGSSSLTLVRCVPLLAGSLSKLDLQRLITDGQALSRSIDAFKEDPSYDAEEVEQVLSAVVRAVLPSEEGLVADILQSLPLALLHSCCGACNEIEAASGDAAGAGAACHTPGEQMWEPEAERMTVLSPSLQRFNIAEDPEISSHRKSRRERFTSCIHAGLQVILLALEEQCS